MTTYKYILTLILGCTLFSCTKMDISPTNIIGDKDIFGNQAGLEAYMARIYSEMPIEDFRYSPNYLLNHFWVLQVPASMTGEALCREVGGAKNESTTTDFSDTWIFPYKVIRDCNYFLENIKNYEKQYDAAAISKYKGECYFVRAFTYYALVKRYGGVPIVTRVLNYPAESITDVDLGRNAEEDTWKQVAADYDSAIALLPESNQVGRASKYAAYAFKARAMLHAGSIAKYNTTSFINGGVRLCGMSADLAKDFFTQAYNASIAADGGNYSLYMNEWAADDKTAQYVNYKNMFTKASSPEAIFVRQYSYPESVHGYDAYNVSAQYKGPNGYSSETNPTLNFVELFDGIDKDANGHISVYNTDGTYKLFDSTMQLFANAEPRLRATVIFPGDIFKGTAAQIWRGIYTGTATTAIPRLIPENSTDRYETSASKDVITSSATPSQKAYTLHDGTKMNPAGLSGIFFEDNTCAMSGFTIRKWLNESMTQSDVLENRSVQPWLEMRYAEVLLIRAEAAAELASLGAPAYLGEAYTSIDKIRTRAGATLLTGDEKASADAFIAAVRKERRKELAFENKVWWDLKRWRVIATEQSNTRWRTLMPFYADNAGKWFFDARMDERGSIFTFDTRWYYQELPGKAITTSKKVVQNPGY